MPATRPGLGSAPSGTTGSVPSAELPSQAVPRAVASSGKSTGLQGALLALLAAPLLYAGWRSFWFLTDDAFISFRYVSNSVLGHGYVWNAPPFLPVEGYSNYLWVLLLDLVWRVAGVEPPQSANVLSLAFAFGTLLLTIAMGLGLPWSDALRPRRMLLVGLATLGVLSNRTFLAWTSSGLETALFNSTVTLWVYACLFVPTERLRWPALVAVASSASALTRPDGLLFWGVSLAMLFADLVARRRALPWRRALCALPAVLPAVHLLWRKAFYGEWLPNTYYAKIDRPWPESGVRYFAAFVLEYALWVWMALGALVLAKTLLDRRGSTECPGARSTWLLRPARWTCIGALLVHFGFYTLVVGGDHFEFRVYSHLVPFVFLSFLAFGNRLRLRAGEAVGALTLFTLLSLPIPWTHWFAARELDTRKETFRTDVPVAPRLPRLLAWYGAPFDDLQAWMQERGVCKRHQEHKVFCETQLAKFPSRAAALDADLGEYPVLRYGLVGVAGWSLPNVNVVDLLGLNDYVIARFPVDESRLADPTNPKGLRRMAHERRPPPGYVQGFQPNVVVRNGQATAEPRSEPLTAESIAAHEREWRARAASW